MKTQGFRLLTIVIVACFSPPPSFARDQAKYSIQFQDVTQAVGLKKPLAGIMGHGGAWGDVNGDGFPDLFVGGFCDRPDEEYRPAKNPVSSRMFLNQKGKSFVRSKQPAVEIFGRTSGAVFADLDNDGDLELYIANNAKTRSRRNQEPQRSAQLLHSLLLKNDQGKYQDITVGSGACPESLHSARNIGVLDYDLDGLLDLFVVEDRFTKNPRSVLLRNQGNLKFVEVNKKVGISEGIFGLGLAVADINEDKRPDIYVPHGDFLLLSDGKTNYREIKEFFGWDPLHNEDWPCGAAFGDLNRDGRLDLVLTIHGIPARNKIYLSLGVKNGTPLFRDVSKQAGFGNPIPVRCPHVEIQDFNNDGWLDIYISAAWMSPKKEIKPLVFQNLGLKKGIPRFQPPQPIHKDMVYFPAGPSADFDKDGRLDLFLINWFQGNYCRLLRNESKSNRWLNVRFVGKKNNRMGIGTKVFVYQKGHLEDKKALLGYQEIAIGYGYASGQVAECHFGLGDAKLVDLQVLPPLGRPIQRTNVPTNRNIIINETK